MSDAPVDVLAAPPDSPPLEARKGSIAVPRKGSVAVGGKMAAGKGNKAVAITGLGADMRKNKAFLIMRQVRLGRGFRLRTPVIESTKTLTN